MTMAPQRQGRKYTPAEWNAKQRIIRQLYISQDLKLPEVQNIMRDEHNFDARFGSLCQREVKLD